MRRAARHLLTMIQASGLLHQRQRRRADDGRIIASIEDYGVARGLLGAVFDAITADGLTPAIRETVIAVSSSEEVTEAELGRRLGLAKSTISYRVSRAVKGGWLENRETDERRPKRLARGQPLPQEADALPEPAELERFDGSNEVRGDTPAPPPPTCIDCGGEITRYDNHGVPFCDACWPGN
jgi:hypothetical protein